MKILRSWREQKAMLKMRFPSLNDKDFDFEENDRETMLSKLAIKLEKTRSELGALFAELQTY